MTLRQYRVSEARLLCAKVFTRWGWQHMAPGAYDVAIASCQRDRDNAGRCYAAILHSLKPLLPDEGKL